MDGFKEGGKEMKARIKATGEIINIADYARVVLDQCDSWGNPIELGFDEVEILQETTSDIDWEQRRYEIAKTVVHGQLTGPIIDGVDPNPSIPNLAKWAVKIADAVIDELKNNKMYD